MSTQEKPSLIDRVTDAVITVVILTCIVGFFIAAFFLNTYRWGGCS